MSGRRIEALICDWGGVLTTPLLLGFMRVQEQHGIPLEALGLAMAHAAEERGSNPLYDIERGEITEVEFLGILSASLEREIGRPVALDRFADEYFQAIQTNDELVDYLRGVKARGIRLACLTNNIREWEPRWRAMLPVDELFELVVDSGFVGMRKPEPEIYALTLERLGLPGEACAFLDDLEVNCEGARALGIAAVQFQNTEQAIAELDALLGPD